MICSCGETISASTRFCPNCGKPVHHSAQKSQVGDAFSDVLRAFAERLRRTPNPIPARTANSSTIGPATIPVANREFPLVLIGLYTILQGLLMTGAGIVLLAIGPAAEDFSRNLGILTGSHGQEGVVVTAGGLIQLILGFLFLAGSYGVWTYQRWGRTLLLWLNGILLTLQFFGLFIGRVNASTNVIAVASMLASAGVIYYLTRPHVAGVFE